MLRRIGLLLVLSLVLIYPSMAQSGKTATVAWPQEPDNLNPLYTTMTFAGYTYQLFLAPAWDFTDLNEPNPVLVTEMPSASNGGISEDSRVFTLTLREGLTWSDGAPLTSADFVFTYDMIVSDANTPLSLSPYDRVVSVEAPDETTVVVTFEEPFAAWLSLFRFVLPQHVLAPVFEAEGTIDQAAFNRSPNVASGPYVLEEWDFGNFMRFGANENFVGGRPIIDTMIVRFIPDETAYNASLIAGESEIGTFIPANLLPELEAAGLEIQVIPSGYNEGLFMNVSEELAHPAMTDVRVREAIALGIDRESINRDLLLGRTIPATTYWDDTPYATPNRDIAPFDQARAAELLDEAGWVDSNGDGIRDKDGVELSLRYVATTRQLRQDVQAVAQQQLAEIGIDIQIINYESNVFFNGYADGGPAATGDYDLAEWSSSPDTYPDPSTFRFTCAEIPTPDSPSGGNWNYFCDPEVDRLTNEQAITADLESRIAIFHELSERIYDSYIWVGLWRDPDFWAVGGDLVNVNLSGVTPFWDVVNWDTE